MENEAILDKYGLFRAKVPRFTSYPPANRFEMDAGHRHQAEWLERIEAGEPVSIYVHIPFCRRICYFCACRTQGTSTLKPVAGYISTLIGELEYVRRRLPSGLKMARLHFGGGTPTILNTELVNRLCEAVYSRFEPSEGFEFSVEIDPTEAAEATLDTLADWRLGRASIGIQDFSPVVQETIGRMQGYEQTRLVVEYLRGLGVGSVNFDLVYGLPKQTPASLTRTLDHVLGLRPDRLALYGYAHVPHMSKRQVMIPEDELPDARERYRLASIARDKLISAGLVPIGIDHFATQRDSLTIAAETGGLRRNFQGYTDDPCETLIGFGASAISRLPGGYVQNAVATAAYVERVENGGLAGHKGYSMDASDRMMSDLVQDLMCRGAIDIGDLASRHPDYSSRIREIARSLADSFPDALNVSTDRVAIRPEAASLARIIASAAASETESTGSLAI